jgi:hypothetical protein
MKRVLMMWRKACEVQRRMMLVRMPRACGLVLVKTRNDEKNEKDENGQKDETNEKDQKDKQRTDV